MKRFLFTTEAEKKIILLHISFEKLKFIREVLCFADSKKKTKKLNTMVQTAYHYLFQSVNRSDKTGLLFIFEKLIAH